jgi:hypothetical protein
VDLSPVRRQGAALVSSAVAGNSSTLEIGGDLRLPVFTSRCSLTSRLRGTCWLVLSELPPASEQSAEEIHSYPPILRVKTCIYCT